uniref:Conopressin-S n=1 Tax=Conus striatus TaxID=6493 RepID=CONO_CONST|nr:RecName: Full=Conopressin-S; Short=Con-S; AltName: Full=Arg-conopressin S [Conus striatus]
CIIRNCPRG